VRIDEPWLSNVYRSSDPALCPELVPIGSSTERPLEMLFFWVLAVEAFTDN
jgi:hypothetical protein